MGVRYARAFAPSTDLFAPECCMVQATGLVRFIRRCKSLGNCTVIRRSPTAETPYNVSMTQSRQTFQNKTNDEMFITLEPWCWRYRLKPGDVFEISFSLKFRQGGWIPLEIIVGFEGDKIGLFIWVNGDPEPEVLLNGITAVEDYHLQK